MAYGDPYWLISKYAGKCSEKDCKETFAKGTRVFYYPKTKDIFFGKCAEKAANDFRTYADYEDGVSGY